MIGLESIPQQQVATDGGSCALTDHFKNKSSVRLTKYLSPIHRHVLGGDGTTGDTPNHEDTTQQSEMNAAQSTRIPLALIAPS